MKLKWIAYLAAGILVNSLVAQDSSILKDQKDKISYCIGLNIGNTFKQQGIEVQPEIMVRAINDVLSGETPLITPQAARQILAAYQAELRSKQSAQSKELGDKNKAEGDKFLAENKAKEGVVTLPSGLQYKVITQATGPKPTLNDTVTTHYRGTLIDGTEFDSSYTSGRPATFPVTGVIKGWTEALQMMNVGSKWRLFIPADLAYGERGRPGIPPNAVLIFDIELLSTQPKPEGAASGTPQPNTQPPK